MQDEPFTSFRQVSHHNLYKDYKNHGSTVILEASGGDEIGAGYTGFLWPMFIDQAKKTSLNSINMITRKFINLLFQVFIIKNSMAHQHQMDKK